MRTSACMDGTLKNQPNKMRMTPQYFPYILCHFANYALCFLVVCTGGLWKTVWWVVLGVQSMYVDVQGESVMLWVAAEWNHIAAGHGRYRLSIIKWLMFFENHDCHTYVQLHSCFHLVADHWTNRYEGSLFNVRHVAMQHITGRSQGREYLPAHSQLDIKK